MENLQYELTRPFEINFAIRTNNEMSFFHYHNSYEILFIESGERSVIIENDVIKLEEGDVLLINSNALHRIYGSICTRILIYFTNEYLEKFYSKATVARFTRIFDSYLLKFDKDEFKQLLQLLNMIQEEYKYGASSFFYLHLGEVFTLLEKKYNFQKKNNSTVKNANSLISNVLNYINQNFTTITSLEDLTQHFYLTKHHLCRMFKKETSSTINQYITILKMRKACELLENTNMKSTEICSQCGFNSPIYFTQCFKKLFNMTPLEYRSKAKEKSQLT